MRLNIGSGQRPFEKPWVNIDSQPKWKPDICADALHTGLKSECAQTIVLHHLLEHLDIAAAAEMVTECYRLLKPMGSVIITVPDIHSITSAWQRGEITDYIFCVNVYGAYMGDPADLHRWCYHYESLRRMLKVGAPWRSVERFDWRPIKGANIASAWWILGAEAVK